MKAISYAKVKTDAVDAETLAQLLRMGYIPEAHQLPPEYRGLRDLLRQRMVMEHKRTNIIQRVSSILAQFNITNLPLSPYQSGFADDKHYCSYCRLVPGAKDSGGKHSHRSGSKDGNQYLKFAFTESAIKAMRFYPQIKHFAARLERRATKAIARTVVAKELAKISYYVLSRQQEFKTFKGIEINKLRNWPRARKPVRLTGGE